MKRFIKAWQDQTGNLFSSQDSKYFIVTASKMTAVPLFFFGLFGYSIWNLMELTYNFFAANGFHTGEEFKEAFYQTIFGDISNYIPIFTIAFGAVFLIGLSVAWLALRPFGHIEKHIAKLNDNPNEELAVQGLNKNKLLYQVSRIFFKYIQMVEANGKAPKIKLPQHLENLNKPALDKVFLLQYALVVAGLGIMTSLLLYSFSTEFYNQIVDNSNELLAGDMVVNYFIREEVVLLEKIRNFTIFGIIMGYISISFSIIKSVDGVSYGFARDMVRIMSGEHDVKLRPRYADPGKSMANSINDYLDHVFPYQEDVKEFSVETDDGSNLPPENVIKNEFADDGFHSVDEDKTNPRLHQIAENFKESDDIDEWEDDDLPPTFIQEKKDAEGNKVFQITTPKGMKVDNLNEDMVLKMVSQLEDKKKAS